MQFLVVSKQVGTISGYEYKYVDFIKLRIIEMIL